MTHQEHLATTGLRYRNSKYFLRDQLRCSDAVSDFQSVKTLIRHTQAFSGQGALRFQAQPVPIRTDR